MSTDRTAASQMGIRPYSISSGSGVTIFAVDTEQVLDQKHWRVLRVNLNAIVYQPPATVYGTGNFFGLYLCPPNTPVPASIPGGTQEQNGIFGSRPFPLIQSSGNATSAEPSQDTTVIGLGGVIRPDGTNGVGFYIMAKTSQEIIVPARWFLRAAFNFVGTGAANISAVLGLMNLQMVEEDNC